MFDRRNTASGGLVPLLRSSLLLLEDEDKEQERMGGGRGFIYVRTKKTLHLERFSIETLIRRSSMMSRMTMRREEKDDFLFFA